MSTSKENKYPAFVYDIGGIACLIAVPLIGWIPGPGGMPLLYLALRLLGKNHKFPRDVTNYLESNGSKIIDSMFPDIKIIMIIWDVVIFAAIASALFIIQDVTGPFTIFGLKIPEEIIISICISVCVFATLAFLRNRRRWSLIKRIFRK